LVETLVLLARADSGIGLGDVRTGTLVRLLSRASAAQLDALAASDTARPLVLREVFGRMSAHVRADRAARVDAVVRWRIGCGGSDYERFQTVFDRGSCVTGAVLDRAPRVTLTLSMGDFLRLATGGVGTARLLASRRLRVKGDLRLAIRLAGMFDIPTG
jgi:putative sterol carrier protein